MSKKDEFLYDARIVERNILEGKLSKKDYEKHLASLPDVEEKGEPLVIEEDEVSSEEELDQVEEEISE